MLNVCIDFDKESIHSLLNNNTFDFNTNVSVFNALVIFIKSTQRAEKQIVLYLKLPCAEDTS